MKKHVQNPNEMYKKTKKKGFLRATAFMMAFMLLLGSVDVSAFAAQNENDETQTVSVQPEEDTNDVVEPKVDDDSTAVEESKEDADEDSGKEPDESLSSENPSDDDSDIKEEEKSEADVEENEIEKTEIEDDSEKEETVEEESEEVEEQAVNYDDQIAVFAGSGVKYEPLTVVSGFNADIVWTAGESQPSGALMDDVGASLYSVSQRSTGGIPNNGIITSCQNSNLKWQIADFKSNNALRLTNGRSGKLTFNKIGCYQTIYFLVTAGGLGSGKSATMHTTITYTDGQTSTSTFTVRDWWDNFNAATTQGQYGRWNGKAYDGNANNSRDTGPYFTQCAMSLDTSRLVESITISSSTSGMTVCVFGITGVTADINAPTANAATNEDVDGNGAKFTASWSSVSNAGSYRLDVATDSNFTQIVKNSNTGCAYNNMSVSGTSHEVTGLQTNTTYYYRVRAVASNGGQSASSNVISITTPYTAKIQKADGSIQYYGSLDEALKNAASGDEIIVDGKANTAPVIKENVELKENVKLTIPSDKNITMANGASLSINGELENSGTLTVESGSKLENSGLISGAGNVQNNGNVTNKENGTFKTGVTNASSSTFTNEANSSWKEAGSNNTYYGPLDAALKETESKKTDITVSKNAEINGEAWTVTDKKTGEEKTYYGSLSDAAKDANAKSEETTEEGDKKYNSVIKADNDTKLNEDITLKDGVDLVVPDGTTVTVPEDTKLTISEGASLNNNGTLDIKQTGSLEIEGKLDVGETGDVSNSGELSGTGDVENKGTIVNDKTGTVKADNLSNVDNGTFKNKNDVSLTDKDGNVYYYSSLDEALKDARERVDDVVINIGSRINPTIEATGEDRIVEIPENVTIVIPENKQLTIANGTELDVRGKIENNGTILNSGTFVLIPESNLSGNGTLSNAGGASWKNPETGMAYYGPLKDALEKAGDQGTTEGKTDIKIDLEKDTEINEGTTIPGNVTVTIPEDKSLTVKAPAVLDVKGTLENEGNLNVSEGAGLNVSGIFDNKGTLDLEGNADLTVSNTGTFNNNGTVSSEAQWTDENSDKHYGTLKDALDSGAKDIELNKDTTVIPEDTTVTVKNGATITVPDNKSLEINGKLEGANENTIINQNEASWKNPANGKEYYGSLKDALDKASKEENIDVTLDQDAKIDGDTTIPDNITLVVPENKNLDVSGKLDVAGKLENQGDVTVKDGADLTVSGTLENTGNINLETNAKLDVSEGGKLDNTGNISLKDGAAMDVSGTVENGGNVTTEGNATVKLPSGNEDSVNSNAEAQWTDKEGNTHFGTLNEALNENKKGNATIANLDTIKSDKGSFVTNANGALMKGSGSIEISGNLINKGSISVEGTVKGITNKGSGKVQSDLESTLTKEHDYGAWIIDEKATATKEGRKHRVCEECGHTVYQEIPATGSESNNDSENTYKEVIQEVGAFDTNLNNQKKELFDGLLSADEKKEVDTFGSSAYIWLEVAPDQNTSPDDKQILEQTAKTLGDNVAVEYSEISLYKRVGFGDKERITDTQNLQISITIDIPEELTKYNKDEVVRKFYMLRAHDGEGAVIDNGIVSEDGTKFTFTTTLFSTYALAYIDSAKTSGGDDPIKPDEPNKPDNPSKPDNPGKPDNSGEANNGSNTGNSNGNSTSGGNTNTSNGTNISTGENNALNGSNGDLSIGQSGTSGKTNYKKTSGSKTNGSKENGKTPDQVASADNDSKKDNASTDSKNDNKGQEDAKNADSGQTSVAETIEKPSKKVEKQLKDAFSQIKKLDSEIQSGPYVQIDASNIESGRNNNDGKVKFILNIPEDIVADGRTFYLVTVDSEGNIVVLQNESLEDGVFSATGDPNATYQIVYEDGESTLAEQVSEEGSLMDTNGNVISVKTVNTCFWHWIIAVLALIGVVLTLLARKNKQAMIVAAIDTVLMLVCVILGSCRWDIVTMLIGVVLLAAGIFIRTRRTSREVR